MSWKTGKSVSPILEDRKGTSLAKWNKDGLKLRQRVLSSEGIQRWWVGKQRGRAHLAVGKINTSFLLGWRMLKPQRLH